MNMVIRGQDQNVSGKVRSARRAFSALGITAAIVLAASGAGLASFAGSPAAPAAAAAPALAETFTVDAGHSAVLYRIKHMNIAWSYGRFNSFSGTYNIAEGGSIDITVKADSVDSGIGKRDEHIKGTDFFSAKEFPDMTFKSSSLKKTGENTFEAAGQLTFRGVTKDITATVEKTGEGPGMGGKGKLQGFEAKFTFKRSEFGMNYMPGGLSEDVHIIASIEGGTK
jgi:polyisoprenoid-binding protein YceI